MSAFTVGCLVFIAVLATLSWVLAIVNIARGYGSAALIWVTAGTLQTAIFFLTLGLNLVYLEVRG